MCLTSHKNEYGFSNTYIYNISIKAQEICIIFSRQLAFIIIITLNSEKHNFISCFMFTIRSHLSDRGRGIRYVIVLLESMPALSADHQVSHC